MRAIHFTFLLIALCSAPLQAQNLVLNGGFDESLIGWENSSTTIMTADWIAADANNDANSGSVQIANTSPTAENGVTLAQCVPVNSGQSYTYGGKVRIPSGPAQTLTNKAVISLRWYSGPDCTTPTGGAITTGGSPQSTNVWVSQTGTANARVGARSVEVRALVSKVLAGGTFIGQFDDITLTSPSILENGFD